MKKNTMQILGIDHLQVAIPLGGEALARTFYGAILGLPELAKPEAMQLRGGAWFACGSMQLHLGVETDFRPAKKAHPALLVADLAGLTAELIAAGYAVSNNDELPEVQRAFTADPFGNRIELIQAN